MLKERKHRNHNSFLIKVNINNIDHYHTDQRSNWKTNASEEQWDNLAEKLHLYERESNTLMSNSNIPIDERYSQWFNQMETIVNSTIGKKIHKSSKPEKFSNEIRFMRAEKRKLKKMITNEDDLQKRKTLNRNTDANT